jgi:hypothetical protein
VIVWHVPPHEDHPVFLYFHGNRGSLRWRVERFRALTADGSGFVVDRLADCPAFERGLRLLRRASAIGELK